MLWRDNAPCLVEQRMFGRRHSLKILGAVVVTNLILVMNVVAAPQALAVRSLPIQAMLKDISGTALAVRFGMIRRPDIDVPIFSIPFGPWSMRQSFAQTVVMAVDKAIWIANILADLRLRSLGNRGSAAAATLTEAIPGEHLFGRRRSLSHESIISGGMA